ncbi:MAG: arginine--tRNA ligase [Oscillospiraceae bacterium]|jgi:arginyl-tRNA synthetase|nr:arginine--tRNA ligase [Oscillospiraceae bacterium]
MCSVFLKIKNHIKKEITLTFSNFKAEKTQVVSNFTVDVPEKNAYGNFTTNAAMIWAKVIHMPSKEIAKKITKSLNLKLNKNYIRECKIAGPGFINFYLSQNFYSEVLKKILKEKENYGRSNFGLRKKVIVEFVSANPTGPMHLGNARCGTLGDCLASIMDFVGFDVKREFYVNDAGNQIEKFADSLEARYLQHFLGKKIKFPENGYQGQDINKLAVKFAQFHGDKFLNIHKEKRRKALVTYALPKNIKKMKADLLKYKISYDKWFFESELYKKKKIKTTLDELKKKKITYEKDGVIWARAKKINCDKDKVLVRKNGMPTYFAADIAYHRDKFLRGFSVCIDVWGADHHGHVAKIKGAMNALGFKKQKLEVLLVQLVKLVKDKKIVKMSKRAGKTIGLIDLLKEVKIDEARFTFNLVRANIQMDFDLELVSKKSSENPVYYVQYAHARAFSILKKSKLDFNEIKKTDNNILEFLKEPIEQDLILLLSCLADELIIASKNCDPTSVTKYVLKIANLFHKFYNSCQVVNIENKKLSKARLCLCMATKVVIKNILDLFKVTAPENM